MDYTQRHFAECADVKQGGDENQDVVLLIPNFSLMARFFVNGGKDPWFQKIMWRRYTLLIQRNH